MRKAVKKLMENHRQALNKAGKMSSPEDGTRQWYNILGDVDAEVVNGFARELQYVVDRLGVMNERICLVQIESEDELTEEQVLVSAGPACQVFAIGEGRYVLLYLGPKSVRDFGRNIANNLLRYSPSRAAKTAAGSVTMRIREVYSQSIVEPMALLSELATSPNYEIRELV
jgi:hypothetical protein